MLDTFQEFVNNTDPVWQWLAVMLAGAVPYVESYVASFFGVLAGVNPVLAVGAAIIGNVVSMLVFVFGGAKFRAWRGKENEPLTPKKQKMKDRFDKYGVAGVSLLGQTLLPSQITSMAMVTFGANRNAVIFWQIISIILWGIAFGVLASVGATAIPGR